MAGKLTDLLNAGLTAQLPLSGAELFEVSQDVGLPTLQTRVASLGQFATAVQDIVAQPIVSDSPNIGAVLHEEFLGAFLTPGVDNARGPLGLVRYTTGAGAPSLTRLPAFYGGSPGVYQASTGGANNTTAAFLGSDIWPPAAAGQSVSLESRVFADFPLPDAVENYRVEVGFSGFQSGQSGYQENDCAILYFDHGTNGGRWTARTNASGYTPVDFDTGVMPDTDEWQRVRVELEGPTARFYINGQMVYETTDSVPISVALFPTPILIRKTAGTSARVVFVDYSTLSFDFTGGR